MKQVYFDMRYADLKLRIANAQKEEETARKHGEVKEAQRQYKLSEKLKKELSDLIDKNTEVTVVSEEGITFNERS